MNRVRDLREAQQMKQTDLAAILNVSQATLSNWERGVHDPDNESLAHLAKIFNCSIDYLLMQTELRQVSDIEVIVGDATFAPYFRVMEDAKKSGISPRDLQRALDFLTGAEERDEEFGE
ncbi:MAG: helix-turn-helix domain-containing protein [Defluviitaleaceae bacterium]|nr:helix-turn-helix domain-containing protein [Defluviitaleaceae bacterium]